MPALHTWRHLPDDSHIHDSLITSPPPRIIEHPAVSQLYPQTVLCSAPKVVTDIEANTEGSIGLAQTTRL